MDNNKHESKNNNQDKTLKVELNLTEGEKKPSRNRKLDNADFALKGRLLSTKSAIISNED